ncbi:hypothetical protein F5X99DRAFT_413674 [Biscogniauxia marginata]|nr:hypothetical protein F5X99DRAFT_413674 [Biscogniauxia marginata]
MSSAKNRENAPGAGTICARKNCQQPRAAGSHRCMSHDRKYMQETARRHRLYKAGLCEGCSGPIESIKSSEPQGIHDDDVVTWIGIDHDGGGRRRQHTLCIDCRRKRQKELRGSRSNIYVLAWELMADQGLDRGRPYDDGEDRPRIDNAGTFNPVASDLRSRPPAGQTSCKHCLRYGAPNCKRIKHRRRAAGLCGDCGRLRDTDSSIARCAACLAKTLAYDKQRVQRLRAIEHDLRQRLQAGRRGSPAASALEDAPRESGWTAVNTPTSQVDHKATDAPESQSEYHNEQGVMMIGSLHRPSRNEPGRQLDELSPVEGSGFHASIPSRPRNSFWDVVM